MKTYLRTDGEGKLTDDNSKNSMGNIDLEHLTGKYWVYTGLNSWLPVKETTNKSSIHNQMHPDVKPMMSQSNTSMNMCPAKQKHNEALGALLYNRSWTSQKVYDQSASAPQNIK
ncbi:hypothetical protein DFP72DRAFT_858138 [Ephemerocybe angulata]|uniref:Uncharacterized protein n=1 Tax=Ephemerocybe angulata TaxID=980116 RepID=A0A8H6LVA4_9AGAR|nr:hypothetical protein DFP72DRAFT_858138 [Tulosesus angulatus]